MNKILVFYIVFYCLSIVLNSRNNVESVEILLSQKNGQICYDGDTCYITINGKEERLRLRDINCPEINDFNGIKARDYTIEMLTSAKTIKFINIGRDKYNRVLANILVDNKDLSTLLVSEGLAREWK